MASSPTPATARSPQNPSKQLEAALRPILGLAHLLLRAAKSIIETALEGALIVDGLLAGIYGSLDAHGVAIACGNLLLAYDRGLPGRRRDVRLGSDVLEVSPREGRDSEDDHTQKSELL